MGKYMKKTKVTGVVTEATQQQFSLGVRTRARSLAIQRLQLLFAPPPEASSSSYLQLRSRRLQKPPVPKPKAPSCEEEPSPGSDPSSRSSHGGAGASPVYSKREEAAKGSSENEAGVEVSFGENVLEVEGKSRNSRETTPCSLLRDSGTIGTLGSTTRPTTSTDNRRTRSSAHRNIPTAREIEEYFSGPEQLQQKKFVEKYNFDPVNNMPLPGRYEWVKLDD